jgi:hypothetical protein
MRRSTPLGQHCTDDLVGERLHPAVDLYALLLGGADVPPHRLWIQVEPTGNSLLAHSAHP